MIKFFRHIRQNLLSEGKTGRYLTYAIGEIVLVVIGILIALSINNWNENRKNRKAEKDILVNIYENLGIDSIQFDYYRNEYQKIDKLHTDLYKISLKNEAIDSIPEPMLIRRSLYFKQLINSDFKENLYDINNQKIKNRLISYVGRINDMELAYRLELSPLINEKLKPYLAEEEIYNAENWFELEKRSFDNFEFQELDGKNIIDKHRLIALSKTKKFQQLLFEVNFKWTEFHSLLKIIKKENQNLRKLIILELKNY